MAADPYAIGSDHFPGLSKLVEENGEVGDAHADFLLAKSVGRVGQVAGKIMGLGHMGEHWDGSVLKTRIEDELADLVAAAIFFAENNGLDTDRMAERQAEKLSTFRRWHGAHVDA